MNNPAPTITMEEVKAFARVYKRNNVTLLVDDYHARFTADFCNLALSQFAAQVKAALDAGKPKVVIAKE